MAGLTVIAVLSSSVYFIPGTATNGQRDSATLKTLRASGARPASRAALVLDKALYRVKLEGHNRVAVHAAPGRDPQSAAVHG